MPSNSQDLKNKIKYLIENKKKGKLLKIFKKNMRNSSSPTLNAVQKLIVEAITINFEYFNEKIYPRIIKKLNRTFCYNDLLKLEKDILEKYCLYDNEKILTIFKGKMLQGHNYVKGRIYLTQYRIFAQGSLKITAGSSIIWMVAIGGMNVTGMLIGYFINKGIQTNIRKFVQKSIGGQFNKEKLCYGYQYPILNAYNIKKSNKFIKYWVNIQVDKKGKIKTKRLKIKITTNENSEENLSLLSKFIGL